MRAAFASLEESKVVSSHSLMVNPRHFVSSLFLALLLAAATVAPASGQSFTISASSFSPSAVDPGNSAIANIDLGSTGGFSSSVSLSCLVTSNSGLTSNLPTCLVSPDAATPPAMPSLTVSTLGTTSPGLYSITVTGVSGSISVSTILALNVVNVTQNYTLSVLPTLATPSPVTAGNVATTTVTVTPIGSYSGHQVTLACLSITPIVQAEPYCIFQYPNGLQYLEVTSGPPPTATLLIQTLGPTPTQTMRTPHRAIYALWLALPGVLIVLAGGTGARGWRLLGLFSLLLAASALLLVPACGTSHPLNNPSGLTTPNNTYTFTLTATDEHGNGPSNSTSSPATVTLQVN